MFVQKLEGREGEGHVGSGGQHLGVQRPCGRHVEGAEVCSAVWLEHSGEEGMRPERAGAGAGPVDRAVDVGFHLSCTWQLGPVRLKSCGIWCKTELR